MLEKLFSELPDKDVFSLLDDLCTWIEKGANAIGLSPKLLYVVGIVIALGVALSGCKLSRLWVSVLAATAGYYLTGNGLMLLNATLDKGVHIVLVYVLAIVFAVILFLLAFKRPTYVFYTVMAIAGFVLTYFYTQNELFSLVGALVLALICVCFARVAFIVVTALLGSAVAVRLLSACLPNVKWLRLYARGWTALGIALGLSVLFIVFQLAINMRGRSKREGEQAEESFFSFR